MHLIAAGERDSHSSSSRSPRKPSCQETLKPFWKTSSYSEKSNFLVVELTHPGEARRSIPYRKEVKYGGISSLPRSVWWRFAYKQMSAGVGVSGGGVVCWGGGCGGAAQGALCAL